MLMGDCEQIFKKCLSEVVNDELLQRNPGLQVKRLANDIIANDNSSSYQLLGRFLVDLLYPNMTLKTNTRHEREIMFSKFYRQCISKSKNDEWFSILSSILPGTDKGISKLLFQYIIRRFYKYGLELKNSVLSTKKNIPKVTIALDESEEETLRYVAGYLAFSIRKSVDTRTSEGKMVRDLISFWGCKEEEETGEEFESLPLLDYTKKWVDIVNRGGLFVPNDQFYMLIRTIELVARSVLNTRTLLKYCGENLRDVLMKKLEASEEVDKNWCTLTYKISNKDLVSKIKRKLLLKWVNLRSVAFVYGWIQIYKRKLSRMKSEKKVSEKGEPSLRKSLASSKNVAEKGQPALRKTLTKK